MPACSRVRKSTEFIGFGLTVSKYVGRKLMSRIKTVSDRTQAAFFLLRTSFTIVRAMRTTPLAPWLPQAVEFDETVRDAAERCRFTAHTETGGNVVDHADIAFSASLTDTCGEKWSERGDVRSDVFSQASIFRPETEQQEATGDSIGA